MHHGGAGTTAAGLRAGVPSILTPYKTDQFFWADLIAKLGVGPKLVSCHQLTPETLTRMICQAIEDKETRRRAAKIGQCIEGENGVGKAVGIIERYLAEFRVQPPRD